MSIERNRNTGVNLELFKRDFEIQPKLLKTQIEAILVSYKYLNFKCVIAGKSQEPLLFLSFSQYFKGNGSVRAQNLKIKSGNAAVAA